MTVNQLRNALWKVKTRSDGGHKFSVTWWEKDPHQEFSVTFVAYGSDADEAARLINEGKSDQIEIEFLHRST